MKQLFLIFLLLPFALFAQNRIEAIKTVANDTSENIEDIVLNVGSALGYAFPTIESVKPQLYSEKFGLPSLVFNPYLDDHIIVFFHGLGERGNGQLMDMLKASLMGYVMEDRIIPGLTFQAMVISPQNPRGWEVADVQKVVEAVRLKYPYHRLTLMGYSSGGRCVDYAATEQAKDMEIDQVIGFAGVSRGSSQKAEQLKANGIKLQLWHFQGDRVVPVSNLESWQVSAVNVGLEGVFYKMAGGSHAILHMPFKGYKKNWSAPRQTIWSSLNITDHP